MEFEPTHYHNVYGDVKFLRRCHCEHDCPMAYVITEFGKEKEVSFRILKKLPPKRDLSKHHLASKF